MKRSHTRYHSPCRRSASRALCKLDHDARALVKRLVGDGALVPHAIRRVTLAALRCPCGAALSRLGAETCGAHACRTTLYRAKVARKDAGVSHGWDRDRPRRTRSANVDTSADLAPVAGSANVDTSVHSAPVETRRPAPAAAPPEVSTFALDTSADDEHEASA